MNNNLYTLIPKELDNELFTTLVKNDSVKIERIVSKGHISPDNFWYDQDQNEFVLIIKGYAVIQFEEKSKETILNEGDWLVIKAHRKHRVIHTSDKNETIWLTVFY